MSEKDAGRTGWQLKVDWRTMAGIPVREYRIIDPGRGPQGQDILIASCPGHSTVSAEIRKERKPNALAMCAAPELLDACHRMYQACATDAVRRLIPAAFDDAFSAAWNAIAKAEGKP